MLRLYLLLAKPNTRRRLGLALRVSACIVLVWTSAVAWGMYKLRTSVALQHQELNRLKTKADALENQVHLQRRVARRHGSVTRTEDISETTQVADEMNKLAQSSGTLIQSIKFPDVQDKSHRRKSKGKAAGDEKDDPELMKANSFECTVGGPFSSLLKLLDKIADSPLALEMINVEISRNGVDPSTGQNFLQLHLVGRLQP